MKARVFVAKTCAASKMYQTQIRKRGIKVEIIDIEAGVELARQLDIRAIPTTIVTDGDKELARFVGYSPDIFKKVTDLILGEIDGKK